jgi:VWFA-related protein
MTKAAGVLMVLLAAAAQLPGQGSNTIRSETKVVLVDAVVTGKKGYVHDLTAKDFQVFEDDKKQTIVSFSSEADPATAAAAAAHYMILLFDDSSMDNSDQRRAHDAALKFVDANTGPRRMIAIVNFRGALRVLQNFTDDAARLKAVLSGGQPAALTVNSGAPGLNSSASQGAGSLFLAVRGLARDLASAPGRKTLVLLSADSQLHPEEHSLEINAALDACNRANVAIYGIDTRGFVASATGFGGRVDAGEPPSRMRMGPLGCPPDSDTIGCQQTSAEMSVPADSRTQAALQMLSGGTGGFAVGNSNDLAGALEKIGKEQNEYYLLSYTPPDSPEGSCHKLRVKVDRGGTSVRARNGFCNARSNNVLAGSSIEKELEALPATPSGGAHAWLAAPFFYSGDLARVNVAMEIPLQKIKTEKQAGNKLVAAVHVLGVARRPDGSVAARFSESVALKFDGAKQLSAFLSIPFHYENQFEILPGSYTLEVAYDAGENRGKVAVPLAVDAYQPAQFALSGLVLSRQYGPATDPRLHTDAIWTADRTPLIVDGMRLVPSGSNVFQKEEKPAVYAEIYEPDAAVTLSLAMRIVDRKTGEQKLDTGVLAIPIPQGRTGSAVPLAKRVPIDGLPPGLYRLELDASDSAGKSAHRAADFEIE